VLVVADPGDAEIPPRLAADAAAELARLGLPARTLEIERAAALDVDALAPPLRSWLGAVAQGAFTSETRGRTFV
jgi:hypothetical protein